MYKSVEIRGLRGILRTATENDAEAVRRIYSPSIEKTSASFEVVVPPIEEFKTRIREILDFSTWIVFEVDKRVVGYAYASKHRAREAYKYSVEVTAYIDEAFHRKGIARVLYLELFQFLKERGFHMAYAGITLPNASSVGLHESLGFKLIGIYNEVGFRFNQWHDVGWWQKRL